MSGKSKEDYKQVLMHLLSVLPSSVELQEAVLDFGDALWRALEEVCNVPMHGCSFHWPQTVWRQVQSLSLQTDYAAKDNTYKLIKHVLGLPFIPAAEISEMFRRLERRASGCRMTRLMKYIEATWLNNPLWRPPTWTVYGRAIRTNNDVEGWHNRINQRAGRGGLPLYVLLILLYKEASLLPTQLKMLSEGKLKRRQGKTYRTCQSYLQKWWAQHHLSAISTKALLMRCSNMGPSF